MKLRNLEDISGPILIFFQNRIKNRYSMKQYLIVQLIIDFIEYLEIN